ncbi:MAG: FtsQ-type POTRA domain-containing protein [Clostridia bacterium]|nr:FtsQ-type POTRA domain-containing protein [Clostridia bacterium]
MRSKRKGNRTWPLVFALTIVLLVICLIVFLRISVVRQVIINGTTEKTGDEIVRATGLRLGSSIFSVDEAALKSRLDETGTTTLEDVETKWPNTVILTVRDRNKDALIWVGGRLLVLDAEGYVIETRDGFENSQGVFVTGLDATAAAIGHRVYAKEQKLDSMTIILNAIRSQGAMDVVATLDVSDQQRLTITTRNSVTVMLGTIDKMEDKIRWMVRTIDDLKSRGENGGSLDVSSGTKADYLPG